MKTVSIHEAETNLARLIEEAARGDELVIADADGKPLVKLVAVKEARPSDEPIAEDAPQKRRIGFLDGRYFIPDDLDSGLDAEIEKLFHGIKT
ncbi:MAG: type II toxin-antitoxin system prevent-host-death family antitoxin [Neorhizobium sp.]|nr:type II toxin-antitoxin system prevent-host-death family antitoxin [Neorhizobium sp.]